MWYDCVDKNTNQYKQSPGLKTQGFFYSGDQANLVEARDWKSRGLRSELRFTTQTIRKWNERQLNENDSLPLVEEGMNIPS